MAKVTAILEAVGKEKGIDKLNKQLNQLFKTGQKLSKLKINIGGSSSDLARASRMIKAMDKDLMRMQRRRIQIRADTSQATRALNQLRARGNQAINQRVNAQVNQSWLNRQNATFWGRTAGIAFGNIASRMITSATRGIVDAFRTGGRAQDIADARMNLLQLTAEERAGANKAINEIYERTLTRPEGPTLNRTQIQQIVAEALPAAAFQAVPGGPATIDTAAAGFMADQVQSLIELQVATGVNAEQAVARAQDFIKAGTAAGRFTDTATGRFDPEEATKFFNLMRKLSPVIGEEFTGTFVRDMMKNMPTLRQTMGEEAIAKTLMLAEEDRTKVVTGMEQIGKSLFNTVIKNQKRIEDLQAAGIGKITTSKGGKAEINAIPEQIAEFSKDQFKFAYDHVKKFMTAKGMDITQPAQVTAATQMLIGNTRAAATLALLVNQTQELNAQFAFLERSSGSVADTQKVTNDSLLVSQMKLSNAFTGLAGETVRAIEPSITPMMTSMTKIIGQLAKAPGEGEVDLAAITEEAKKMAAPLAGMTAGFKVLAATGALSGIGLTAGFRAMMDPATAPLGAAGIALSGAASNLDNAAAALTLAAGAQGLAGGAGGKAGLLARFGPLGLAAAGAFIGLSWLDKNSAVAHAWIQAAKTGGGGIPSAPEGAVVGPGGMVITREQQIAYAEKMLADAKKNAERVAREHPEGGVQNVFFQEAIAEVTRLKGALDALTGAAAATTPALEKLDVPLNTMEDWNNFFGQSVDNIQHMMTSAVVHIGALKQQKAEAEALSKLNPEEQWRRHLELSRESEALAGKLRQGGLSDKDLIDIRNRMMSINALLQVPTAPTAAGGGVTPAIAPVPVSRAAGEAMPTGISMEEMDQQWAAAIATGALDLTEAIRTGGVTAALNLTTGVEQGGTGAGASIASQLIAAGSQVGTIIAAAVQNAAANIKVNVTQNSVGVDTGAQTVT